ncbi:MAG TPA: type IX secretion system membrane protein PorP/SprF [Flavobacteriales bacterium]|nr:type IX secretion system membrane protein PorP/SprF [Flavobacteriales bacterium]HRJ34724.1 type IX secretion system membrane protein PorP/SprF [Flavobacteriales bacterium]HRJ39300.1 type IX secretion system membrane protein PorP/SprF [Flavobacteriales bacterium]
MKKLFIASALLVSGGIASAQQMQQLSQYLLNPYVINPAAAGLTDFVDLNLSFRQQWVGFENSPQTFYLSGNSVVGNVGGSPKYSASLRTSRQTVQKNTGIRTGKMRHAVGGNVMGDRYGAFKRNMFNGSYALHLPVANGINASIGVGVGMSNVIFDQAKVTMLDPNDNTYAQFLGNTTRGNLFDVFTGVYLYSEQFQVGYSSAQLLQNKLYFGDPTNAKLKMHHFFMGGYRFDVNEKLSITPNFLLKYMNPAPMAIDLNCKVDYDNMFFGGFSYRHKDAIVGMLGMFWNNIKIGYSYDYTISSLRKQNSGGHEIVAGYRIRI